MSEIIFNRKDELRFWKKVHIGEGKLLEPGCWEWTAAANDRGYGTFGLAGSVPYAHRVAWAMTKGTIPEGEGYHGTCVLHKCDNTLCVRPSHLFLGSHADNMADMEAKGRGASCRGEKSPSAKLTEEQVLEIRASGESHYALAARYGVSHAAIYLIRRRKNWKHLREVSDEC